MYFIAPMQAVLDFLKQETAWKTWCAHCYGEDQDSLKIWTKYIAHVSMYTVNDCWLNVKAMLGNKKKNNFKYKILELLCILMRCQKACTGDLATPLNLAPIFSENTAAYLPVNTVHNNIICSQKITSEVKCKLNK